MPASNVRMLEKAPELGADIVMLDLEDSVAPDEKEQARFNVIGALRELDWSRCSVSLRINGLDTHYCYRDLVDVVEQAGDRLDSIMIPKASGAADVQLVATLLTQIEDAMRLPHRIAICVLIETALGMLNCDEIARACPERMEAMVFGVADFAASIQSHTTSIGGTNADYAMLADPLDDGERELHLGDQWHYALARIAVACRAYGLAPDRRAVRRLHRPGGLSRVGAPRRGTRLRGQVGDPPVPDRARQRGLHPQRADRREDTPDHRRDAGGGGARQGRRVA